MNNLEWYNTKMRQITHHLPEWHGFMDLDLRAGYSPWYEAMLNASDLMAVFRREVVADRPLFRLGQDELSTYWKLEDIYEWLLHSVVWGSGFQSVRHVQGAEREAALCALRTSIEKGIAHRKKLGRPPSFHQEVAGELIQRFLQEER